MRHNTACANMVADAVEWIVLHLNEFDPFKDGRPFEIKHGQKVGELAILLQAYASLTGNQNSEPVKRIASLLISIQKNPAFTDRLVRSPVEFVLFAEMYAALRSLGHDNLDQREMLQRVIDARFLDHTERLPHRAMDIVSCLEWGGFSHNFPSLESLYANSMLARVPNAAFLDEDAVYFLTHVIMFLYSFGTRKEIGVPFQQTRSLGRVLSTLLIACCREHHWDLVAELLLCWDCIGLAPTFVTRRAWQSLLQIQKEDGALPGPEWAEELHQSQKVDDAEAEEIYFAHHYHTTLVSIIAGCLQLNRLGALSAKQEISLVTSKEATGEEDRSRNFAQDNTAARRQNARQIIVRTRSWLDYLTAIEVGSEIKRPEDLSKILLGYWICDSLTGANCEAFDEPARRIGEALSLADENGTLDWSKTAPALKLIVASLLSSRNVFVPFLHSAQGFLVQAVHALNASESADPATKMLLYEKRLLLHAMGLQPQPPRIGLSDLRDFARSLSFVGPESDVEGLLLRIHSYTSFGTRQVQLERSDYWIADLLAGLALTFFRKYDLPMGSRILRALSYLGVDTEDVDDCVDFLRLHQRPEGAFGFFGAQEYELLTSKSQEFSADFDLKLPITIECLWAIREASDRDWRMYQTIPQLTHL